MSTELRSTEAISTAGLSLAARRTIVASILTAFDIAVTIFVVGHIRYLYRPHFSALTTDIGLISGFALLYVSLAHVWYKAYCSWV